MTECTDSGAREFAGRDSVLITGAGGLLGRSTAALLIDSGRAVTTLARADLDIADESATADLVDRLRPAVVINCAAATDVDRCEREPDYAYRANEQGPRNLARACSRKGAALVHISTDYVFDGEKEGFYTQEDEPNPLSEYAKSKLAGERAVAAELDRVYIVRSSWIFGPGGKNFGSRVLELARKGAHLKGVTDQFSIPTYAPDLGARIIEIINTGTYGLYHVTNTGVTTWMEFARLALDIAGLSDVSIEPVTRAGLGQPAKRPRNSALRCLFSEKLGLPPLRSWQGALREFIQIKGSASAE